MPAEWTEVLYQATRIAFAISLLFFLFLVVRTTMQEQRDSSPPSVRRSSSEPLAVLVVIDPAESGLEPEATFPIIHPRVLIGRSPEAEIRLTDPSISAIHASIRHDDGRWFIEDLASRNGTRVNGEVIAAPARLQNGNLLQFGRMSVRMVC